MESIQSIQGDVGQEHPSGKRAESPRPARQTCRFCTVGRGYRPILDYVELCTLHTMAQQFRDALKKIARRDCEGGHIARSALAAYDAAKLHASEQDTDTTEEYKKHRLSGDVTFTS